MVSKVHWSFLKNGCCLISSTPFLPNRTSLETYETSAQKSHVHPVCNNKPKLLQLESNYKTVNRKHWFFWLLHLYCMQYDSMWWPTPVTHKTSIMLLIYINLFDIYVKKKLFSSGYICEATSDVYVWKVNSFYLSVRKAQMIFLAFLEMSTSSGKLREFLWSMILL